MSFRNDTFIGAHHYWIRFYNGTHEVRCVESGNEYAEIESIFTGHYEKCVEYIREEEIKYLESVLF